MIWQPGSNMYTVSLPILRLAGRLLKPSAEEQGKCFFFSEMESLIKEVERNVSELLTWFIVIFG